MKHRKVKKPSPLNKKKSIYDDDDSYTIDYAGGTGVELFGHMDVFRRVDSFFWRIKDAGPYQPDCNGFKIARHEKPFIHFEAEPADGWIAKYKHQPGSRHCCVYFIGRIDD